MAEERNVGLARAREPLTDEDATKAELQRRMEEARESITQTVTEIKDTVANQYQNVRESINEALDWREQFRRRPAAFSAGALGVGLIFGYGVGGAFGRNRDTDQDYDEATDTYEVPEIATAARASSESILPAASRGYAAQAVTGGAYGSSAYERSSQRVNPPSPAPEIRSSLSGSSSNYDAEAAMEPPKPSMIDRFKETKAYDRLEAELYSLGDRFVEELSRTAQTVVVPALLGKLKDLIGIDLSTQREVAQRSTLEKQTTSARAQTAATDETQAATTEANRDAQHRAVAYGTSENTNYSAS